MAYSSQGLHDPDKGSKQSGSSILKDGREIMLLIELYIYSQLMYHYTTPQHACESSVDTRGTRQQAPPLCNALHDDHPPATAAYYRTVHLKNEIPSLRSQEMTASLPLHGDCVMVAANLAVFRSRVRMPSGKIHRDCASFEAGFVSSFASLAMMRLSSASLERPRRKLSTIV